MKQWRTPGAYTHAIPRVQFSLFLGSFRGAPNSAPLLFGLTETWTLGPTPLGNPGSATYAGTLGGKSGWDSPN